MKQIVYVENYGDKRYKKWAKILTGVDRSKSNGYCFEGQFVSPGTKQELNLGTYILNYGSFGSARKHKQAIKLFIVTAEGLEAVFEDYNLNINWALDVRDRIADLLDTEKPNPMAGFPDDELRAEFDRRFPPVNNPDNDI